MNGLMCNVGVSKQPLFLQNGIVRSILQEVVDALPKKSKCYLIGGALRNAVYYHYFKEVLPQRDYDLILMGSRADFIKNLRKKGFVFGKVRGQQHFVMKKKKIAKPLHISDYVVLDVSVKGFQDVLRMLREKVNFTINGFALDIERAFFPDWYQSVVMLPHSLSDLKERVIRSNKVYPTDVYACIRFVFLGFKPPSKKELDDMISAFEQIIPEKRIKNVQKLYDYVGEKKVAKRLARRLGFPQKMFYSIVK